MTVLESIQSPIGLGTGSSGSEISKEASFAVLDAYAECGGDFIDTAHIYAAWVEGGWGASERTVGEWLRSNNVRNDVILATKGGHPPLDRMELGRCSRADLESDLAESLDRLGVDRIDLYWLHRDDPDRPVEEIMNTLAGFVRDGRVRAYGASNWTIPRFAEAQTYCAQAGIPPFIASQCGWALADRRSSDAPVTGMLYVDDAMRGYHEETKLPLFPYTAQAKGYFGVANARWAESEFQGPPPIAGEYDSPDNRQRLLRASSIARDQGCSANQVALSYLLHQPFPTYPLISTSRPDRVRDAMGALKVTLTDVEVGLLRG
ncbi:MAG: aldo/keto reductase [bacterium]|nr:aldo/keto reductase [bacterium]